MFHSFFYLFHGLLVHLKCILQRRGGSIISFYISRDREESWSEFFKVSWRLVADRKAERISEIPVGFNRHRGMLPLTWKNKKLLSSDIYYLIYMQTWLCVCVRYTHVLIHAEYMMCNFFSKEILFWNLGILSLPHSSFAPSHWRDLDNTSSHSCVIITTARRFWIINAVLYQRKTFSFCTDTDPSIKPHGVLTSHLSDVAHWHLQCRER